MSAGLINSGSFAKRLWPGVNNWFGASYSEHAPEYTEIFKMASTDKRYEETVSMDSMGLPTILNEGDAIQYASAKQGYTTRYVNVEYAKGFIITRLAQADDQYAVGLAETYSRNMAFVMRQAKEIIAANVLNNAFSSSFLGGDASALCATAHANGGLTYSNKLAVDADFSEASLEQALIDLGGMTDSAGLKIAVNATKLIIPKEVQFDAARILKSDLRVGTADNDINATKALGVLPGGVAMNHYLTDTDAWFLLTDCPDGLKGFQREGYMLESADDFDTSNSKFKVTERYCFGWDNARGIYGSQGA